jgi:Spy/CpxP family protein refolding chaperone
MITKASATILAGGMTFTLLISGAIAQGPPVRGIPPGGPGRGPGGMGLIQAPAVQKELGLTEKQKAQIKKVESSLAQKRRQAFAKAREDQVEPQDMRKMMEGLGREQRDAVAKVLEPKQKTRLTEIELQQEGVLAVARKDVASKLKLTAAQSEQVEKIEEDMRQAERNTMPGPGPGGPPGFGRRRAQRNQPGAEGDAAAPGGGPPGEPGVFPGGGPPPGEGAFPDGGGPPGEGGFPGGGGPPPGEGAFPGAGGPPGGPPDFNNEEMRARFEEMRREREKVRSTAISQINTVLSAEQKSEFKKLQGKPFELASLRPGPGPGTSPRTGRAGNRNRPQSRTRTRRGTEQPQEASPESP